MDFELPSAPSDGISRVRFAPAVRHLLVSSWDKSISYYDMMSRTLLRRFQSSGPVLDVTFGQNSAEGFAFHGGLAKEVKMVDLSTGQETLLGSHNAPVKCVEYSQDANLLFTAGWDKELKIWDHRSRGGEQSSVSQPERVFSCCLSQNRIIVATAGRHIYVYDTRNMSTPEQRRESALRHQTRSIAAFPDGTGFVVSSIEGRVAVEFLDPRPEAQAAKYAFKCHRKTVDGTDMVYPVNAIAFHPIYGTFTSGGGDGVVNVWDRVNKKRIFQMPALSTSVASLDFSHDGSHLAIASSYTWEKGDIDHPPDKVLIHEVRDSEVKPKPRR